MVPDLSNLLQVSTVDAPIVALSSTTHLTGPPEEYLHPEDKRMEKMLVKGHQVAAWSVMAVTAASFFNRASLLWLKQLQDRTPTSDTRSLRISTKLLLLWSSRRMPPSMLPDSQ